MSYQYDIVGDTPPGRWYLPLRHVIDMSVSTARSSLFLLVVRVINSRHFYIKFVI